MSNMRQQHKFLHQFQDGAADGVLSMDTDATETERIQIEISDGDKIWLSANRTGWLHLARVCAELGMADYAPGYHFHKTFDFKISDGSGPEISFEVGERP